VLLASALSAGPYCVPDAAHSRYQDVVSSFHKTVHAAMIRKKPIEPTLPVSF
jgi:hypothetical protein